MSESPLPPSTFVFADGELQGPDRQAMLNDLAIDPATAGAIAHQRQLRDATARTLQRNTPGLPDELRTKIQAMADQAAPYQNARSPVLARIGRWAPAAVAALLFLSTLIVFTANQGPQIPEGMHILPISKIEKLAKRHVTCSRQVDQLHQIEGVTDALDVAQLPQALTGRLGGTTPGLDLTGIGYQFERIGSCPLPGKDSVHLIYRADPATGRSDMISLWIFPDQGTLPIEEGHLFVVADENQAHPILIWRSAGIAYYLVGDTMDSIQKAGLLLGPAT